ncbi:MAG TPA: VWA domain-containing protein, partial [Acidimicrobiales bacterium]
LRALMRRIRLVAPLRRARRHHRHPRGDRPDLRATLRRSRRTGGDPVERVTRRARLRPRRIVVLCDISGSMAPYSRACIQLLHAAATGGGPRAEVFTFATRLTRLTRVLAVADPDAALAAAASTAPDWNGGTRIGASLKEFLDRHGRRGVARGAVVVVVSDGWDRDDPALVGEQMARLRRLAHRIVWINPRTAAPGYEPLAGGMAAALAHCDRVVSGHTLVGLAEAVGALAG